MTFDHRCFKLTNFVWCVGKQSIMGTVISWDYGPRYCWGSQVYWDFPPWLTLLFRSWLECPSFVAEFHSDNDRSQGSYVGMTCSSCTMLITFLNLPGFQMRVIILSYYMVIMWTMHHYLKLLFSKVHNYTHTRNIFCCCDHQSWHLKKIQTCKFLWCCLWPWFLV